MLHPRTNDESMPETKARQAGRTISAFHLEIDEMMGSITWAVYLQRITTWPTTLPPLILTITKCKDVAWIEEMTGDKDELWLFILFLILLHFLVAVD